MSREQRELNEIDGADEGAGLHAVDEADEVEVPEEGEAEDPVALEDDEDADASWDELLERRAAARDVEDGDDVIDLMSLSPAAREPVPDPHPAGATPVRKRQEFVCTRCHLVKPRTQLADASRGLCRDCV